MSPSLVIIASAFAAVLLATLLVLVQRHGRRRDAGPAHPAVSETRRPVTRGKQSVAPHLREPAHVRGAVLW
jgi:hypothetical protein